MVQLVSIGKGMAQSNNTSVTTIPTDFITPFDGVSPVFKADPVNHFYYLNSTLYTSDAAYVAADGALPGSGRVPVAALGAQPWTWQFNGICPSSISASRNYAFALYGNSTNGAYLRLDQTSGSQYTVVSGGANQFNASQTVSGSLGSAWTAAGTFAASAGRYSSIARAPSTGGTATVPTINTGLALGYQGPFTGVAWGGTFSNMTVWPGALSASAVRALSSGNLYGPSRVTCGGQKLLNVGDYTYSSTVATNGDNVLIKIRNDNRQMVGIKTLSSTPGTVDDHNYASLVMTQNGGMCAAWTNHDTGNVFYFATCPDLNMDNFSGTFTFTMGGTLIPAYSHLTVQASTGKVFFFCRTNQSYWNIFVNNNNGASGSWTALGRFIDDSVGAVKLLCSFAWVDASTIRVYAREEPQYLNCVVKVLDVNVDTLDITSGSGSIGTVGVGNGATFASCSTIWNPGAGFSATVLGTGSDTAFVGSIVNDSTGSADYYWINCDNPAAPYSSASWSKNFIVSAGPAMGATSYKGGICVIGVPGLSTPQVAISRLSTVDNMFHLETYVSGDSGGSSWSLGNVIAVGGDNVNQLWGLPGSVDGADSRVPFTWFQGTKNAYNDFSQQIYWQRNAS